MALRRPDPRPPAATGSSRSARTTSRTTLARHGEAENALVAIDLASGEVTVLAEGADFYAAPRLSPDGTQLAWLELAPPEHAVGRHGAAPRAGRRRRLARRAAAIVAGSAVGLDRPAALVARRRPPLRRRAGRLDEPVPARSTAGSRRSTDRSRPSSPTRTGSSASRPTRSRPTASIVAVGPARRPRPAVPRSGRRPAPSATIDAAVHRDELDRDRRRPRRPPGRGARPAVRRSSSSTSATGRWTTVLQAIARRRSRPGGHRDPASPSSSRRPAAGRAYGKFYRADEPLVPRPGRRRCRRSSSRATAARPRRPRPRFDGPRIQLFTSRGFAVLDVDYGGSHRLRPGLPQAARGRVGRRRPRRLRRRRALARRAGPRRRRAAGDPRRQRERLHDALRGHVQRRVRGRARSYFGIGDLETFVKETHKFESRYTQTAGRAVARSAKQLYHDRSPLNFAERISCPVLILQGAEDRIVPPAQAEQIVDALWEQHLPHAYLLFPGEDHGFRGRGEHHPRRSRRSSRSTARSSGSRRPTRSSRSRSSSSTRPGQPRPEAWRPGDAAAPRHQRRRGRRPAPIRGGPTQAIAVVLILLVAATAPGARWPAGSGSRTRSCSSSAGSRSGSCRACRRSSSSPRSSSCCSCRRSSSGRATSRRSATSSANLRAITLLSVGLVVFTTSPSPSAPRRSCRAWAGRRRSRSARSSRRPTRWPRRRSSSGSACLAASSRSSRARASSTTRRRSSPTASRSSRRRPARSRSSNAGLTFVAVAVGGIAFGLLIGLILAWALRRIDDPVFSVVLTLLAPVATYLPAEQFRPVGRARDGRRRDLGRAQRAARDELVGPPRRHRRLAGPAVPHQRHRCSS